MPNLRPPPVARGSHPAQFPGQDPHATEPRATKIGRCPIAAAPSPRFSGFSTPWKILPQFFHAMESGSRRTTPWKTPDPERRHTAALQDPARPGGQPHAGARRSGGRLTTTSPRGLPGAWKPERRQPPRPAFSPGRRQQEPGSARAGSAKRLQRVFSLSRLFPFSPAGILARLPEWPGLYDHTSTTRLRGPSGPARMACPTPPSPWAACWPQRS